MRNSILSCAILCQSRRWQVLSAFVLTSILAGCSGGGSESSPVGTSCTSSSGESGTVVENQSKCYVDDAFCELRTDGHYCTGASPLVCPEGQTRNGWTSCGFPSGGSGGGSDGGATSNGGEGGQAESTAGGVAGGGGGHGDEIGASCTSSSGLSGTVVESRSKCYLDDAFCEQRSDGLYCTGGRPFVCPEGQVRTNWTGCGFPSGGSSAAGATAGGAAGVGDPTNAPAGGAD